MPKWNKEAQKNVWEQRAATLLSFFFLKNGCCSLFYIWNSYQNSEFYCLRTEKRKCHFQHLSFEVSHKIEALLNGERRVGDEVVYYPDSVVISFVMRENISEQSESIRLLLLNVSIQHVWPVFKKVTCTKISFPSGWSFLSDLKNF